MSKRYLKNLKSYFYTQSRMLYAIFKKKKTEAILINGYDTTVDDFGAFKIESDSDEKLRFEGFVWPRWGLMDPFCKRCRFNVRGSLGFSKFKFQN